MLVELLAQADVESLSGWVKLITTGGAVTVLAVGAWLVTRGTFRHERELEAKQKELDYERDERKRERSESDATVAKLQSSLDETNKQLLLVLETGRRSQALAQQLMPLAQNVQADKP